MVLGQAGVPQEGLEVGRGAARKLLMGGSKPGVDLGCLRVRRSRSDTLPKHQFGGGYEETMKGRSSKVTHLFHPLKGVGGYIYIYIYIQGAHASPPTPSFHQG